MRLRGKAADSEFTFILHNAHVLLRTAGAICSGTNHERRKDASTSAQLDSPIPHADAWKWDQHASTTAAVQILSGLFESPPVGPVPRAVLQEASVSKLGSQFKFVNRLPQCKALTENFGKMDALRGRGFEAEKRNLKVANVAGLSGIGKTCFVEAALLHLRDVEGAAGVSESVWPGEGASHEELMSELLSACDNQRNLRITLSEGGSEATVSHQLGAALLAQWTKHCALREGGSRNKVVAVGTSLADLTAGDTFARLMKIADLSVYDAIDTILSHASAIKSTASTAAATIARRPALIVHLDEAQLCSHRFLQGAIALFSDALLTRGQRVFLVITGLPSAEVEQALRWTSVASLDIVLPLLDLEHMVEIIADLVGVAPSSIPVGVRNALWMLGGVPRFLEYFMDAASRKAGVSTRLTRGVQSTWDWLQRASLPDLSEVVLMTSLELYRPADTPSCILDALFSLAVSGRHVPLSCVLNRGHPSWTVARAQNARLVYWEGVPGGDGPIRMPPILLHLAHLAAGPSSGPRIVPLSRPGASLSSGDNESLAISVFMHRLRAAQIASVTAVQLSEIVGVPLPVGMEDVLVAVPQCFALRVLDHRVAAGGGPHGFSTLVSATRASLATAPLSTAAAFINGRGAEFGDSMLVLPEIIIVVQEKQSVLSRQAQASGTRVPLVPPNEVALEVKKISITASLLPALIVYVSDDRDRGVRQALPAHTTVVASAESRRALLGPLVAGLWAHSLEENDTRATSIVASAVAGTAAGILQ